MLRHDPNICIGCMACEQACVDLHHLRGDERVLHVEEVDNTCVNDASADDKRRSPGVEFALHFCRQCQNAACLSACPSGAIKREGSVVKLNKDVCTGCGRCVSACRFGVITVLKRGAKKFAYKCMLCTDVREEEAGSPACVGACPVGALLA